MGCDQRGRNCGQHQHGGDAGSQNRDFGFYKTIPDITVEKPMKGILNTQKYLHIPNPDKPVEAKRKSRFIGEMKIDD
jgi:hypothetical protein